MRYFSPIALLLVVAALYGCGSSDDPTTGGATDAGTSAITTLPPSSAPEGQDDQGSNGQGPSKSAGEGPAGKSPPALHNLYQRLLKAGANPKQARCYQRAVTALPAASLAAITGQSPSAADQELILKVNQELQKRCDPEHELPFNGEPSTEQTDKGE